MCYHWHMNRFDNENDRERFSRTRALLGEEAMQTLAASRVAVFGLGGVGGHCAEALARSGVGALDLVDGDFVALSNCNRQVFATDKTVGMRKAEAAKERIALLSPRCRVTAHDVFFLPENADSLDFSAFDYVVDAIDTVSGKVAILERARLAGVPAISAMGAGNKLDPTRFEVAPVEETSVCPLARVMRRELKKRGISGVKAVYSKEEPRLPRFDELQDGAPADTPANATDGSPTGETAESPAGKTANRKPVPGSVAFVPSVMGLIIAGEVVKDLTGIR